MSSRPDRSALTAIALAAVTLTLTTPAANAAWSPATALVRPAGESVRAAGAANGLQVFVWKRTSTRSVRTRTQSGQASSVIARARLANGRLGSAQTVSSSRNELVTNPAIGVDDAGNATAVWTQAGRHIRIMAAIRPRTGRFGRPFEIGRTGVFNNSRPAIAVAPDGRVLVAWQQGRRLQAVWRPPGRCRATSRRRCFSAAQSFPAGADHTVAIGPGGDLSVVWAVNVPRAGEPHSDVKMVIAPSGGQFGPPRLLSDGTSDASQPALAIAPDGSAIVAYRRSPPTGGEQDAGGIIAASIREPDGQLTGPLEISATPGRRPVLGVTPAGEAILVYDATRSTPENPDGLEVVGSLRAPGAASFAPALAISAPDTAASSVSAAVDSAGNAHVVYSAAPGGRTYAGGPVGLSHLKLPAGPLSGPVALPADFTGAFVFAAGARVTAVSGGSGAATRISDWTPL